MAFHASRQAGLNVAEGYTVVCPDVVAVRFDNHPEYSGEYPVGIDGRIEMGKLGKPRVEGETVYAISQQLGDLAGSSAAQVHVTVTEFHGQVVYLFGEVMGQQRAVPYRGQETVLDLLQRTGGITQGAEPEGVYVVRGHVGDAKRPEVFHVDLRAIVIDHDERTNLRLQPFDQVHVAATRRAGIQKVLPPWMRKLGAAVQQHPPGID